MPTAIGHIRPALPTVAADADGVHFKFAARNGVTLVEQKRRGVFVYWLIAPGLCQIVRTSDVSKFRQLRPVGETLPLTA